MGQFNVLCVGNVIECVHNVHEIVLNMFEFHFHTAPDLVNMIHEDFLGNKLGQQSSKLGLSSSS